MGSPLVGPDNSFKPTSHRGVGHLPALRWQKLLSPAPEWLTQTFAHKRDDGRFYGNS